jgi:hypothetical protein
LFSRRLGPAFADGVLSLVDSAAQLLRLLRRVRTLEFVARSNRIDGWNGRGRGHVRVALNETEVLFHESGEWTGPAGRVTRFQNTYRWTGIGPATVRLEHLRRGARHAVHLLDLSPVADTPAEWRSAPHLCAEDTYAGTLQIQPHGLQLAWTVRGPHKDESLATRYFSPDAKAW